MLALVSALRAWITHNSRWRLLWAGLGAVATIGGVIGVFDLGYSRFVENPRVERRQEQLERKIDELAARLVAGASNQPPGQQQQVAEAIAAAKQGAQAGDERFARAIELLKAGKTEEASALFRVVAEEKTHRIEQDRLEAAAAGGTRVPSPALPTRERPATPTAAPSSFSLTMLMRSCGMGGSKRRPARSPLPTRDFARYSRSPSGARPATQRLCGRGWASGTCWSREVS
ncbi:MAG: hypothetical protein ACXW3X_05410 [Rhodoplanes sp.]